MSGLQEKTNTRMRFKNYFRLRPALPSKLLLALLLPLCSFPQQNKLVLAPPDPVIVKRGGSVDARLRVATIPGFHVNSNTPSTEYQIPLTLTWNTGTLRPQGVRYPQPETIDVGTDKLSVFTGTFYLTTTFNAPKDAKTGSTTLTGQIHYQACNNRMCFRPATIPVTVPVTIE